MPMGYPDELLVSGLPADPVIYQATTLSSGAALALVVWDAILTLENEVDHIWSKSSRAYVKWIYLFTKWFGLLNQMSDSGIQIWHYLFATRFPVPASTCTTFYIFEAISFQLLQLCLDAVLILRIWAVYQRHRRYIAAAVILVLFEILMSVLTQAIAVPKSVVDGTCTMIHTPATTSFIGIGMIVAQSVLLCLTFRGKLLMQPAARYSRVFTVVVRDGMLVFFVVTGIILVSFLYLLVNQVVINVFLPWLPVMPSLLTPRIILNMQMAAEPTESVLEFTTHLDTIPNSEIQPASTYEAAMIYEQYRDSL